MAKRLLDKRQKNRGLLPGKGNVSVCSTKRPSTKDLTLDNLKKTAVTGVQLRAERARTNVCA